MSTELALLDKPEYAPIKQIFEGQALAKHYETENPFKMNFDREKMFMLQLIQKNPYLLKCTADSFYNALINVTATGLTLNPLMQQAHLVPRAGKVCLDPDYKGLITIMISSGIVKDVFAHVVYANDEWEYDAMSETVVKFNPYWNRTDQKFTSPGEEVCTFCCVVNPDNTRKYRVMPIHRVNEIMEGTEAYKSHLKRVAKGEYSTTMWQGVNRPDMVKKTVIRQMWKFIPKSDNMMFHALAKAFEQHDEVNRNTDYEQAKVEVDGTDVKLSTKPDVSASLMDSIKTPAPRKGKQAEVIQYEEVEPKTYDDAKIAEAIMFIADNFEVDFMKAEQRGEEQTNEVKKKLIEVGIVEADLNAWLVAKKAKNKTMDALCKSADSNQINLCLLSFIKE